ncbi:MAG: 3-phosphoserine/phosphohydroxythreonine transaminase [Deltaproteobacteria bacterium]|nr:3-phosphoserine/phosphohydroxythreonine transaminase [Deltaproteobacteria bacterium]
MSQKYDRVYNFSPGPANLPESVLEQVRDEMMNYKGSGVSIMEISHRAYPFDEIMVNVKSRVRQLLGLGEDYAVLFLQGGASTQFSMLPMNLQLPGKSVDLVHTGHWTQMALDQLKKGFEHRVVASGEKDGFKRLPELSARHLTSDASYVHMCSNNTIYGTQWKTFPDTGKVPLVCDMSSDIMSRRLDFSRFDVIFAGAQKNLGPSGVCLVVIKQELAERASDKLPTMLQYRTHIKNDSRFNTPPAFGIYVMGLVLDWIVKQGGLDAMEKQNNEKAKVLYDAIDSSSFYESPLHKPDRSLMNVVFRIKPDSKDSEKLEESFIKEAKVAGLTELKGHRVIGGLRASIYNAHPLSGVQALAQFMREFERKNG